MQTKPSAFGPNDQIRRTEHMKDVMRWENIQPMQVINALTRPALVLENSARPGQWKFVGDGVAVIVSFDRPVPVAVTISKV